jgi:alpha-beta hydrolase superfamily lysophospholipase
MTEPTLELLDRLEVLSVLFHPRREAGLPQLSAGVHTVRLEVEDNLHIGGKIFAAAPGAPVVIFFHGNGEIASDYEPIAPLFRRLGLTLFVIDYRGYGMSDGRPTSTALLRDAWAAYQRAGDVLAARGITFDRLYLMGRSLGSAAVLEIAARSTKGIAGLIIESGFAHTFPLLERLGGMRLPNAREDRDGFGNLAKIAGIHLPTLIIHGEEDFIIPVEDGRDLYDASPAEEKHFVTVPGAGHNDLMLIGRNAYFAAIAQFCGLSPSPQR